MIKSFPKKKKYNTEIQIQAVKSKYNQFRYTRKGNGFIEFLGFLKPTEDSINYKVKIIYRKNLSPKVFLLEPKIDLNAPHIYPTENNLCLYNPSEFEWDEKLLISKYIIPWTAIWLFYYEIWLKIGIWTGPESSHNGNKIET